LQGPEAECRKQITA